MLTVIVIVEQNQTRVRRVGVFMFILFFSVLFEFSNPAPHIGFVLYRQDLSEKIKLLLCFVT